MDQKIEFKEVDKKDGITTGVFTHKGKAFSYGKFEDNANYLTVGFKKGESEEYPKSAMTDAVFRATNSMYGEKDYRVEENDEMVHSFIARHSVK